MKEVSHSRFRAIEATPPAHVPPPFSTKMDAVEFFTSRSLSSVPASWIAEMFDARGIHLAMPMWGELFIVNDRAFARRIEKFLCEYDFGEDTERQFLIDCGWRFTGRSRMFGLPIDDRLVLGIDGAGYNFFESHWEPLYDQLGLLWHVDD